MNNLHWRLVGARRASVGFRIAVLVAVMATLVEAAALALPAEPPFSVRWDFTRPPDRAGWQPTHDVAPDLRVSQDGMIISITGPDPYITSPRAIIRPTSLCGCAFAFEPPSRAWRRCSFLISNTEQPRQTRSSLPSAGRNGRTCVCPLPPLGPGYRLRFDPPGTRGTVTLASFVVEPRVALRSPDAWPPPAPVRVPANSSNAAAPFSITSGDLRLVHAPDQWAALCFASPIGQWLSATHVR
jgi:hypothetical protein